MFKSELSYRGMAVTLALLSTADAWAAVLPARLPGPGVLGLIAAAVVGAIGVSRSRSK